VGTSHGRPCNPYRSIVSRTTRCVSNVSCLLNHVWIVLKCRGMPGLVHNCGSAGFNCGTSVLKILEHPCERSIPNRIFMGHGWLHHLNIQTYYHCDVLSASASLCRSTTSTAAQIHVEQVILKSVKENSSCGKCTTVTVCGNIY